MEIGKDGNTVVAAAVTAAFFAYDLFFFSVKNTDKKNIWNFAASVVSMSFQRINDKQRQIRMQN